MADNIFFDKRADLTSPTELCRAQDTNRKQATSTMDSSPSRKLSGWEIVRIRTRMGHFARMNAGKFPLKLNV